MNLKRTLSALVQVISDEADRNAEFRARIESALGHGKTTDTPTTEARRKGGRRTPAILDPIELARQGEAALRGRLTGLDIEQLRDIVAEYGMDPGKLVMKWKDHNRIVDRIVELSLGRATKGDVFRSN